MKRIFNVFVVMLAVAAVFMTVGFIFVKRGNINRGDIADRISKNLQHGESNVEYQPPKPLNLSGLTDVNTDKSASYPLNAFNTIHLYSDHCTVEFIPSEEDNLKITMDTKGEAVLYTAVNKGELCIENKWADPDVYDMNVIILIAIPENYKGGYILSGNYSDIMLCDIESSMDMSFCFCDSKVETEQLSAGDITLELSGTTLTTEHINARGTLDVKSVSSKISSQMIESLNANLSANSSDIKFQKVVGGLSSDLKLSSLDIEFHTIAGHITVNSDMTKINMRIKHNAPVSLRHEESYTTFSDNVKWTEKGQKNENSRYIIDMNSKLSIVSLSEME